MKNPNIIIGLDFSINKPASCVLENGKYSFYSWPFDLPQRLKDIYRKSFVNIVNRTDEKYKGKDSSEKMRWEASNSRYLADIIIKTLNENVDLTNADIVFEGLSYASGGNVSIQLGGFKYILMDRFRTIGIPFSSMYTYAPITIKKTAGSSEKGKTKSDVIDSFIKNSKDNPLKQSLLQRENLFRKKTGTWIDHLDDLVDSYWTIETHIQKMEYRLE